MNKEEEMKCINCNNNSFYECENINSAGGYGPDLLPGTGILYHAKLSAKICSNCNFIHWFINDQDMERIKKSTRFELKEYEQD